MAVLGLAAEVPGVGILREQIDEPAQLREAGLDLAQIDPQPTQSHRELHRAAHPIGALLLVELVALGVEGQELRRDREPSIGGLELRPRILAAGRELEDRLERVAGRASAQPLAPRVELAEGELALDRH